MTKMIKYGVVIGNREEIQGKGVCQVVLIQLLGLLIQIDLLPIDLGKMDVILRMQWLCTTGFMGVHWPSLTTSFGK